MNIRQRTKYIVALPLFIVSVFALQFANVQPTYAAERTWTGGGDGTTFSDTANWSTGTAPVEGDSITLPGVSGTSNVDLINDIDASFAGISLASIPAASQTYTNYSIDTISLQAGAGISATSATYPYAASQLSDSVIVAEGQLQILTQVSDLEIDVAGDLLLGSSQDNSLSFYGNLLSGSTITGSVVVGPGSYLAIEDGVVAADYAVGVDANLSLSYPMANFSTPISLAESATLEPRGPVDCGGGIGMGACSPVTGSTTIASPITLTGDAEVVVAEKMTVRLTGDITYAGHTLKKQTGSEGTLIIGSTEIIPETKKTTLSGSQPATSVQVAENETAILSGDRGFVSVYGGGILKGTGSATYVFVSDGAAVNPGNSPGTLTILDSLNLAGTYVAEVLNSDQYDVLEVGEDYSGSSNAVYLGPTSELSLSLYSGWSISNGDSFTIIDNKSATDVSGTFADLDEGSQFAVGGVTFSITYEGGDGNDVVVTALSDGNDPNAPNTGAAELKTANPALVAGLGIVAAGMLIAFAVRRRNTR